MSVLLQISDTHFGTEVPAVVEALARLTHALAPAVLVLSGDVTQRARRSQFAAARRFVERLAVPQVLVIPGNHDIPLFSPVARALWPYANYQREFGRDLAPELDTPDWRVICVNTTRPWRHTDGEISTGQIHHVCERLRSAAPHQLRLVVTHQPLHVPHARDEHDLCHDHEAAARAWCAAGADVVMGGHIHLPYVHPMRERYPDLPREMWCVQSGTALSWRVRPDAPNSVHLLRRGVPVPEGHCRIERWDFHAGRAAFEQVAVQDLALDRA